MSPYRFEHLLSLVSPLISKQTTRFRKPIPAEQRLAVTFANGETQQSLSYGHQVGKATMSNILVDFIPNFKKPVFKKTVKRNG